MLLVLAAAAYFGRGLWLPKIRGTPTSESAVVAATWQPLTPEGGARAKRLIEQLSSPSGPASVDVAPGDLAAYIVQELSATLPSSADSIRAAAIGDRLCVRAVVRTSDVADKNTLGPLAMLLGAREPVQMCGVIRILAPRRGELQVKEFRIRELGLPGPVIPRLIRQMSGGDRPADLSDDGLPLTTPAYIADVRVANGQITLYKTAQR